MVTSPPEFITQGFVSQLDEAGQELCALKDGQLKLGVPPAATGEREVDQPLWEINLPPGKKAEGFH